MLGTKRVLRKQPPFFCVFLPHPGPAIGKNETLFSVPFSRDLYSIKCAFDYIDLSFLLICTKNYNKHHGISYFQGNSHFIGIRDPNKIE